MVRSPRKYRKREKKEVNKKQCVTIKLHHTSNKHSKSKERNSASLFRTVAHCALQSFWHAPLTPHNRCLPVAARLPVQGYQQGCRASGSPRCRHLNRSHAHCHPRCRHPQKCRHRCRHRRHRHCHLQRRRCRWHPQHRRRQRHQQGQQGQQGHH